MYLRMLGIPIILYVRWLAYKSNSLEVFKSIILPRVRLQQKRDKIGFESGEDFGFVRDSTVVPLRF